MDISSVFLLPSFLESNKIFRQGFVSSVSLRKHIGLIFSFKPFNTPEVYFVSTIPFDIIV